MTNLRHKDGKKKGYIMLYALSTCIWCQMTKELLEELGVEYHYYDMDLIGGDEKVKALEHLMKHNPSRSFPTLIINDGETCIKGYKEDDIKEALK